MKKKWERHPLSVRAYELLRKLPRGETLTYDEIERNLGIDPRPQQPGYYYVKVARDRFAKEGIGTFHPVDARGIKHLSDEEVMYLAIPRRLKKARRQARFLKHEAKTVNLNRLTKEQQDRLQVQIGTAAVMIHCANARVIETKTREIAKAECGKIPPPIAG